MTEQENKTKPKTLLEEGYEMTENKWKYVSVRDLNRLLTYRFEKRDSERRSWVGSEARAMGKNEHTKVDRQAEILHLLALVNRIEENNFVECCKFLMNEQPNAENQIQPLYIPNTEETDPELLSVKLDSGEDMIIRESSFSRKFPTEIDTISVNFPS